MAYAQTQQVAAVNTTANAAVTLSSCTAGRLITIQFRFALGIGAVTIPSGFALDVSNDNSGAAPCIGICSKVAVGGETTLTFTNASGGTWEILACEWSGGPATGVRDTTNINTGSAVTSLAVGSITPAQSGELMLAALTNNNTNGGETATGSGWTDQLQASFTFSQYAYKIKADALVENPSMGWTTSRNAWSAHVAYHLTAVSALPDREAPRGTLRGTLRGTT